jgi:cell division protein FtsX
MEKHKKILEYSLSSLMRRKYKTASIIAVYSFVIAVLTSILFLTYSMKREAVALMADAPELIVQKLMLGRHDLVPEGYAEKIRGIEGVRKVFPRFWGYYFDISTNSNYTLMGVGKNIPGLKLLHGRMPSKDKECAIGRGIADMKDTDIGGRIFFFDNNGKIQFKEVVGVFDAVSEIIANDLVLLTEKGIKEMFSIPEGKATDLVVEIYNQNETPVVARKIKWIFPDSRPIMKKEIISTYEALFSWRSGMVLAMFAGALIAFCILAWDKATGVSAEEKREIGILKAIGWETSNILELKFWEGLVISFSSFLSGVILGYVHIFFFNASIFAPVLKGWSTLFPQFRLVPYIDLYQIVALMFFTVVPYIASTVIPSWKTAITDPDSVMRG